jgi:hypothetical protein
VLKAFMMTSIQPKETEGSSGGGAGGWSDSQRPEVDDVLRRIRIRHAQRTSSSTDGPIPSQTMNGKSQEVVLPLEMEWKFGVDGIYKSRYNIANFPGATELKSSGPSASASISASASASASSDSDSVVYNRPVLVMKGQNSKFVRSSHIPSITSMFPLFTLLTIKNAGHWVHAERPQDSAEALVNFIRTVETRYPV